MKTTDIHSHMFNLKYLPVAGILRRYTNNKIPLPIARGVERYLVRKTKSSFEQEKGLAVFFKNIFKKLFGKPQEKFQELLLNPQFKVFSWNKSQIIQNFSKQLDIEDLKDNVISEALASFQEMMAVDPTKKINFASSAASGKDAAKLLASGNQLFDKMMEDVFKMVDEAMGSVEKGLNFARWFAFMLNSEEAIANRIIGHDSAGVTRFTHKMMDVDYFFTEEDGTQHKSHFDFVTQQIPNMEKLDKKYQGKLNAFVAFNPARPDGLTIVKDAIAKGFKGVKFYPPLGYRAFDDPNPDFKKRIDELFAYCSIPENDIPIFSHCNNQGFEAFPKKNSGYNSNPVYWEQALAQYPNLRLCLAHGGGTEGWFGEVKPTDHIKANDINATDIKDDSKSQENWNNSYAAMVFKLCVNHPNVYCDAAYLDDMVNANGEFEPEPKENFQKRLITLFTSEPKFSKKIIYGSDWHMLFQEGKNAVYYQTYLKFYSDGQFDNFRDDFFERNAASYLKF